MEDLTKLDLDGIFKEDPKVRSPEEALMVGFLRKPTEAAFGLEGLEQELQSLTGLDLKEIKTMEADGSLDRLLSTYYYLVSIHALRELVRAIAEGLVGPEVLFRSATELPKVAQKLAGKDISKHLILNEERLLELLSEAQEPKGFPKENPNDLPREGHVKPSDMDFPKESPNGRSEE